MLSAFYLDYLWGLLVVLSIALLGLVSIYRSRIKVCGSNGCKLWIFGIVFQLPLLGYLYIGHETRVLYKLLDYLF